MLWPVYFCANQILFAVEKDFVTDIDKMLCNKSGEVSGSKIYDVTDLS